MQSHKSPANSNSCRIYLAQTIIPVEPAGAHLSGHGLCVNEHGRIEALARRSELRRDYPAAEIVDLGNRILLPGLVNSHTHAAMSLLRGLCNDRPLAEWLEQAIWPAENRWLDTEFVRCGTELAIAEMLQTGTTCFNDMYLFPEQVAEVADRCGVRALVGLPIIDFPTPWAKTPARCLERAEALLQRWENHPRLGFALSPHAPYTVSDASFAALLDWHRRVDENMLIQTHLHESSREIEDSMRAHGSRPINRLERLGVLERDLLAIHLSQASEDDIDLCRRYKIRVAHCPQSNAHFANGIAPITKMRAGGLDVGLGTDGAASNNNLDLYEEMGYAALLAKIESGQASALPAGDALWMACMGGARALGIATQTGSLQVGKWADFQAIEFVGWSALPVLDIARQLVYTRDSFRVSDVWIAGRPVMRAGQILCIDQSELKTRVDRWRTRILSGRQ